MLTRLARWQLTAFGTITVVAIVAVSVLYLRIPSALGIGTYDVTVNLAASGGLYKNANVAYRGTTVGKVTAVALTKNNGVDATMQLDSGTAIPENVTATVKSMSAIGEQYVDLVPPPDPSAEKLRAGSRIARERTSLPGDVAGLLREAENLVNSLNQSKLRELLRETFKAFDGSGPELARLLESARLLVDEANQGSDDTLALIDQAGPLLDAQIRSGNDIVSSADGLARLTSHLREADSGVRSVLGSAPDSAAAVTDTFSGIRPSFPILAANLANAGRIGTIYHKSLEQVFVIFPALTGALLTVAQQLPADEGAKVDFKFNLGDPPPCLTGFLPPTTMRSPADDSLKDLPKNLYCKTPPNDPATVRGARNYPCQEFPGKRAPTVALCRDPAGYVPIGNNPWRGPPVPVGTPVTDPRMTLPMNKYPYIPPQADPDPGPPVVQLPPGVPPGPGPAASAPYPKQPPPVTPGPQPPPLPFLAPPDQQVPPYGRQPDAPAPAVAPPPSAEVSPPEANASVSPNSLTYDPATGQFQTPDGQIGVFASGAAKVLPPETWTDLMMYPRTK